MFENCYNLYSIGKEKTAKQRKRPLFHASILALLCASLRGNMVTWCHCCDCKYEDATISCFFPSFRGILVMVRTPISQEFNLRSLIYRCNYLFFPLLEGSL